MLKRIFTVVLGVMAACVAVAQVTTSSVVGRVTDAEGPVAGAHVVFVHTPSQTQYSAVTDHTGAYHLEGMRVGGPYEAEFSFVGYKSVLYKDVMLDFGGQRTINAHFDKVQNDIENVVVVAGSYNDSRKGSGVSFTSEEMGVLPTVSRSIYDFTRLSPYAQSLQGGGMSIAGASGRYNSFQIDGVVSNDIYGLTSNGTNGGLTDANPIPIDALEAVQVVVAPFDVRQNGFTGGGINAITKSGTNRFTGTAYAYFNNQDFYGKGPAGNKLSTQNTQIYGASIGGAIVKDKLFFFVNGEYNGERSPSSYYVGYNGCNLSEEDAVAIARRYEQLTGYDGGGYGRRLVGRRSGSLMARLDWNINSRHNLTLRYNFLDATKDEFSNTATTFNFNGTGYASVSSTHSIVAELNSRASQKVFNQLRVGYTNVYDGRDTDCELPMVQITKMRDGENTSVSIGTDAFAGANSLRQHSVIVTDNLSIYAGNHTITLGTHNEIFTADNLFVANIFGAYTYNTLDDFLTDNARKYVRNYPIVDDGHVRYTTAQFGLYVQDQWRTDNFSLTYGLRADMPVVFGRPMTNEAFNGSEIAQKYGVATGVKPRTSVHLSPRIGFRWDAIERDDYSMVLRGGVGLFTGKIPFVWITNCYSNTGMTQRGYTLDRNKGQSVPAFGREPSGEDGVSSNPAINVVDERFRYPQVLRANLAFEQNVKGWNILVEGVFSKTYNNIFIYNLIAQRNGASLYAVGADAATEHNTTPLYETSRAKQYSSVYYLTNTNKGYSYSVSASLSKHFPFGLSLSAAYTFGHSYSVNDGVSSQAASVWGKNHGTVSDEPRLSFSIFDTPHKISASLSYTKRYAGKFGSTVSLIYQGYSGMRYSLTYGSSADVNGDGYYGNSTIYIPTQTELQAMQFEDDAQREAFGEFVESNRYLRNHRGEYSRRNAMQAPFEHHLDLHFAQDFYFGNKSDRKVQLTLDVMNLGNLLCRDWGASYYLYNWKLSPVEIYDFTTDAAGNKTPKYRYVDSALSYNDLLSRWRMQIGVRVVF